MNQYKHIPFSGALLIFALALLLPFGARSQAVFDTPLKAVDHFFEALGQQQTDLNTVFSEQAIVTSLGYDSAGKSSYRSYTPASFHAEVQGLRQAFEVTQEPVVIVYREYMSAASIFCSVWSQFVDRTSADTLVSRSIQSFKLVHLSGGWKINHIVIQNENPAYPLEEEMWPAEITRQLTAESSPAAAEMEAGFETYDPSRVYTPAEVDEPPVYPGDSSALDILMRSSNVLVNGSPGYTPFTVVIAEDGHASLYNPVDLSNYQRAKAETFVRSMLIWYPAILDAASVKCKLTFYIRE